MFVDLDRATLIFATPTREQKVVSEFKADFETHLGRAEAVINFSSDMWKPYHDGIKAHFENAALTIDRYRVIQMLSRAVNEVRRAEQRNAQGLKGHASFGSSVPAG